MRYYPFRWWLLFLVIHIVVVATVLLTALLIGHKAEAQENPDSSWAIMTAHKYDTGMMVRITAHKEVDLYCLLLDGHGHVIQSKFIEVVPRATQLVKKVLISTCLIDMVEDIECYVASKVPVTEWQLEAKL